MDRIARLINTSGSLRRQIWASLPFSLRVADFFSRIAVSTTEAFGKTIYGEFLTRGIVKGMPDIHGKPASEFDITKKPIANHLPPGYGREYGKKAFLTLMKQFHLGADATEKVMLDFLVRFLDRGSRGLDPGATRQNAEAYVFKSLFREALNFIRKKREVSDVYFSGGEPRQHDTAIFDEETADRQLKRTLPKIKSKLQAIHPDASLYVLLSIIEGYTDREIIGDVARGKPSRLTHPYSRQGKPLTEASWGMTYKPKIFDLLKKSFPDLVEVSV
jgi:hypothetical protein